LKLHATKVGGVFVGQGEPGISVKLNLHAAEAGGVRTFETVSAVGGILDSEVKPWLPDKEARAISS